MPLSPAAVRQDSHSAPCRGVSCSRVSPCGAARRCARPASGSRLRFLCRGKTTTERTGKDMQKTYVLDTNVLIQAPHALRCFEDNRVVLPLAVLEELDGLKNSEGERGANARQAIRFLETLRRAGSLPDGVPLPAAGACAWRSTAWTWRSRRDSRSTGTTTGS